MCAASHYDPKPHLEMTVPLMLSDHWVDRLIAEYCQLMARKSRLGSTPIANERNVLTVQLTHQYDVMNLYANILRERVADALETLEEDHRKRLLAIIREIDPTYVNSVKLIPGRRPER